MFETAKVHVFFELEVFNSSENSDWPYWNTEKATSLQRCCPLKSNKNIHYPLYPESDVHYAYGPMGSGNQFGRVTEVVDGSGRQQFFYDKLGNVSKNIRTFALPNDDRACTFTMEYCYDTWNRMLSVRYPDGENVTYDYNKGGDLHSVCGDKNGIPYRYIASIRYNRFGNRERMDYGNGACTRYEYDTLQRLTLLCCEDGNRDTFQHIRYTFDPVGNITAVTNNASLVGVTSMGGVYQNLHLR